MKKTKTIIRRILPVALAMVLVLGMTPAFAREANEPPAEAPEYYFEDVPEGSYYFDAVYWALDRYVTNGTGDTTFSPDLICTRAQVMTFLWRAKGEPEPGTPLSLQSATAASSPEGGAKAASPFTDVTPEDYYYQAVLWAVGVGITNGTSATTFSPDKVCNYAEILTFLWRAGGAPETAGPTHYTENWPDSWYKDAVSWAEEDELLEDAGAAVDPMEPCTRARTVTWLYRDAQYYVDSVEELMNAVGPGRDIHLAPGTYNLSPWMEKIMGPSPDWDNPYVIIDKVHDGYELQFHGLKNTEFLSSNGKAGSVKIVVEPRYANVLSFYDCDNIMLTDLTLGHTSKKGECAGGVIHVRDSGELWMRGLDLSGGGSFGISAKGTAGIYVSDSVIRDCTEGLVQFDAVVMARFDRCECKNTKGSVQILASGSWAVFSECEFHGLTWDKTAGGVVYAEDDGEISFIDCRMDRLILQNIMDSDLYNENVFVWGGSMI